MSNTEEPKRSKRGGARPNSGGARKGAGRKKTTDKVIGVRLPQAQVDWLKEQEGTASSIIRELIVKAMKK